jgi:parvulin-like peptidyl-prolyl isomerase
MRSITLFILAGLMSCHAMAGEGGATAATPKPAPATSVIASQGGSEVTLRDVDAYAQDIPADKRADVFASPERIETVLRGLLMTKQLAAEARKQGMDKNPLIQAQMQLAAERALAKAHSDALGKQYLAAAPDLEELAHERYLANPRAYDLPAKVDVKHILFGTKTHTDGDAKALADKIYAQLEKSPGDFDADVMKYSDDPSKTKNQGLIHDATSDHLVQEFREAAGKLTKVGEILPPFKTPYGYHIIKAIRIDPAKPRSFAEVHDALIAKIRKDYVAQKVQDHLDELRSRKIDADPDLVASLRTRYGNPSAGTARIGSPASN